MSLNNNIYNYISTYYIVFMSLCHYISIVRQAATLDMVRVVIVDASDEFTV